MPIPRTPIGPLSESEPSLAPAPVEDEDEEEEEEEEDLAQNSYHDPFATASASSPKEHDEWDDLEMLEGDDILAEDPSHGEDDDDAAADATPSSPIPAGLFSVISPSPDAVNESQPTEDSTFDPNNTTSSDEPELIQTPVSGGDEDKHDSNNGEEEEEEQEEPPPPPPPPPPEEGWSDDSSVEPVSNENDVLEQQAKDDALFEDTLTVHGPDSEDRRVVSLQPRDAARLLSVIDIPNGEERLAAFACRALQAVAAQGRYVLVIHCASADELINSRHRLAWIFRAFVQVSRLPVRKYLHRLIVVHPSGLASSVLWAFAPALSRNFWRKLVFCRRLVDLVQLGLAEQSVPAYVEDYERALEQQPPRPGSMRQVSTFDGFYKASRPFNLPVVSLAEKCPFGLPIFVVRCVSYLCAHGLRVQGLFRVPGNADDVQHTKRMLEQGKDVDFGGVWSPSMRRATQEDVHIVAALLKTFFRDLQPPLLTPAAYEDIVRIAATSTDVTQLAGSLAEVVALLPLASRVTLQFLIYFLSYLASLEKYTQMTVANIAIVWAPNLVHKEGKEVDRDELNNISHSLRAVTAMITHCRIVFPLNAQTRLPPCFDMATGEPLPDTVVLQQDVTAKPSADRTLVRASYDEDLGGAGDEHEDLAVAWSLRAEDVAKSSIAELRAQIKARGRDPAPYVLSQAELCRYLRLGEGDNRKELARIESLPVSAAADELAAAWGLPIEVVRFNALVADLLRPNPVSPADVAGMTSKQLKAFVRRRGLDPSMFPMRSDLEAEARRLLQPRAPAQVRLKPLPVTPLPPVRVSPAKPPGARKLPSQGSSKSLGLRAHAKDLVVSSRELVDVKRMPPPPPRQSAPVGAVTDDLKHEPLFAHFSENAKAKEAMDEHKLKHANRVLADVDTMAPDELRAFIQSHGLKHGDCKGVGALRARARMCFLDDDESVPTEALIGRSNSSSKREGESSGSSSKVSSSGKAGKSGSPLLRGVMGSIHDSIARTASSSSTSMRGKKR